MAVWWVSAGGAGGVAGEGRPGCRPHAAGEGEALNKRAPYSAGCELGSAVLRSVQGKECCVNHHVCTLPCRRSGEAPQRESVQMALRSSCTPMLSSKSSYYIQT